MDLCWPVFGETLQPETLRLEGQETLMTFIPGTNREDGPCVVWVGSTIHGLDPVYGPFPNIAEAQAWAKKESNTDGSHPGMTCSDYLILMLDTSHVKAEVLLVKDAPTYDAVEKLQKKLFPHGYMTAEREDDAVMINTGLRVPHNPDLEEGPMERCYDDNDVEIERDYSWEENAETSPPICIARVTNLATFMKGMLDENPATDDDLPGGLAG